MSLLAPPAPARSRPLPVSLRVLLPVLVFSAFLTEVKLIPTIRNNIGLFEVLGALFVVVTATLRSDRALESHRLNRLATALLVIAGVSLINIAPHRLLTGAVQTSVFAFFLLYLIAMNRLSVSYRVDPGYLLGWITLAVLIVGPWIMQQSVNAADSLDQVGPFRNRAHMGSYMLTAFWLVFMNLLWPRRKGLARWASYAGLALTLYAIAISGRRSVYLSLIVGLSMLGFAFVFSRRGTRARLAFIAVLVVSLGGWLYRYGYEYFPRLAFFKSRIVMVDDRLLDAIGVNDNEAAEKSFLQLQREGVAMAFRAHPFIGVGWGGFGKSQFSPTGHEVHSTPMRFLAETGIVGLALYLSFMGFLLLRSYTIFRLLRRTEFGASAFVMTIGLWSMMVSYLYNRHVTERTFWLILAVFLAFDALLQRMQATDSPIPDQPPVGLAGPRPLAARREPQVAQEPASHWVHES